MPCPALVCGRFGRGRARVSGAAGAEDKLTFHMRTSVDQHLRRELVQRITSLAERFAPDNEWYVRGPSACPPPLGRGSGGVGPRVTAIGSGRVILSHRRLPEGRGTPCCGAIAIQSIQPPARSVQLPQRFARES